jgi:L-fuconate dehydratase
VKVGGAPDDDARRLRLVREAIGPSNRLMIDANQRWDVAEAIERVKALAKFDIWWMEEPTFPDDVLGHAAMCEHVQHLSMFDYIGITGTMENRVIEFVDHLHEHFADPVVIRRGHYLPPVKPGYSTEIIPESRAAYLYPSGRV